MHRNDKKILSSKQLMEKIGLNKLGASMPNQSLDLLDDDADMGGDLVPLLRERFHQLKEVRHTLRAGMIVTWKPGLKNRRCPAYGAPAVALEILSTPLHDTDEAGSTYFREPLDIIIGLFLDSGEHRGDFLVFHANSQRYQPWSGEEV
jgi:hypothetical protein